MMAELDIFREGVMPLVKIIDDAFEEAFQSVKTKGIDSIEEVNGVYVIIDQNGKARLATYFIASDFITILREHVAKYLSRNNSPIDAGEVIASVNQYRDVIDMFLSVYAREARNTEDFEAVIENGVLTFYLDIGRRV